MHVLALLLCVLAVAQGSPYCPSGADWYHLNDRCYRWVAHTEGWFGAELNCRKLGGQLATVRSAAENSFLHTMANCANTFWIGMVRTDVRKPSFSWWDGSQGNFTAPLSITHGSNCVSFERSNYWDTKTCHSPLPYICETPALTVSSSAMQHSIGTNAGIDASGPGTSLTPTSCPAGWLNLEGTCYFVSSDKANYFNAQMSCQAMGASVASILSARQQTLLSMALGCGTEVWIGLEKVTPCPTDPSSLNCFVWMDRKPLNISLWRQGHPLKSTGYNAYECAISNGPWTSKDCHNKYRYICKKK